ncbi:MAG TPA: D-aminoacylase [Steroidobacteraceae bacterium]
MQSSNRESRLLALVLGLCAVTTTSPAAAAQPTQYDVLIRGGTIYDGSGQPGFVGDVGVIADRIAYVGRSTDVTAKRVIDAQGLAVAPGFINMLSWANESLIVDGNAQSDVRQGVTLEVMGEGWSEGPFTPEMKRLNTERQTDIHYPVQWDTLGGYLDTIVRRGISPNIASFVGATTVRVNVLGEGDVDPTPPQLARMQALVRQAMQEGAMGVGSALIYAPGSYAETPELKALMSEVARCDGMYISHMRSEGDRLIEAIDEVIDISRSTGARATIYHFKQLGVDNWPKIDMAIGRVDQARKQGLQIAANIYPYTYGGTGLSSVMPPWVQAGGLEASLVRLRDPATRSRIIAQMHVKGEDWENLYLAAGGADGIILAGFRSDELKPLTGQTLAAVARKRGKSPEETAIDLLVEDGSRVSALYRLMSEENVARGVAVPWMSFGSDEAAPSTSGEVFQKYQSHPRAFGTFAKVLGHYVRETKTVTLTDAVRRLSALPAASLHIRDRGQLKQGWFADIAIFDPATIADRATYEKPMAYAVGMREVMINGTLVLSGGEHTGARPGRVVRGPGWSGWPDGGACSKVAKQ